MAPASGVRVSIIRVTGMTQATDFQNNTAVDMDALEDSFDKLAMRVQELSDGLTRSFRIPATEVTYPSELTLGNRASKMIEFDSNGGITFVTKQSIIDAGAAASIASAAAAASSASSASASATSASDSASAASTSATNAAASAASAAASAATLNTWPGSANITTVGALNSGSITSGFGSIDIGTDTLAAGAISGTTGTFTGRLTSPYNTVTGATPGGLGASMGVNDFFGGVYRMFSVGADISTNGQFYFYSQRSNDSNQVLAARITETGLNNTVIGATTPAAGSFTTLSATGTISTTGNTNGAQSFSTTNSSTGTSATARFIAIADAGNGWMGATSTGYTDITGGADALVINANSLSGGIIGAIDGVKVTATTSTGLAVTGTLGASGNVTFGSTGSSGVNKSIDLISYGATLQILANGTSGANGVTYNTSFANGGSGPHIFQIGATEVARFSGGGVVVAAGRIGINATPGNDYGFQNNANVSISGGGAGTLDSTTLTATANNAALIGFYRAGYVAKSTYTGLAYYGLRIDTPTVTGTGTIETSYGIFLNAMPSSTTKYGIYQSGTEANYFGGEVQSTVFRASGGANDGRFDASFTGSVSGLSLTSSDNATDAYFAVFRKSGNTPIGTIRRVGITDAVAYNTTSDGALKENFRSITSLQSGAFFDRVRPWVHDWKSGAKDSTGYVAQELYADLLSVGLPTWGVTPGTVGKSHWQVDYSKVPDPITAAEIKSLRARVAALEAA